MLYDSMKIKLIRYSSRKNLVKKFKKSNGVNFIFHAFLRNVKIKQTLRALGILVSSILIAVPTP